MTSTYKNTLLALLLICSLGACKKGWLDETSGNEIRSEDQFSSESGFRDALMGAYISMTDPALYSKGTTWGPVDILSHQYSPLIGNAQYVEIYAYNYRSLKGAAVLDAIWNKSYNSIANINNALMNMDKNKSLLHPINYAIIKGELLGLRAMLHFDLLRLYGYGDLSNRPAMAAKLTIPYVNEFKKDITPQLNYTQTFALLNKDLEEAALLLKEDPIFNNPKKPGSYYAEVNREGFYNKREQRMNYYAVKAVQARAFLWQGGQENMTRAAAAAEEVIKDSPARLVLSTGNITTDPVLYPEHIFNLNVVGLINITQPYLIAQDAANLNEVFLTNAYAQAVYETSNANIGLADFRYTTLLSQQTRGMVSRKLIQTNDIEYIGRNTVPLIKLPEMYYIAAEHYATTNTGKAVEYLNIVRKSRGINADIPAGANTAAIKTELDKEYQKEFISEGQLFFQYKRLGKTAFPGLASTVIANDNIYVIPYPNTETELGNRIQ